jgi:hypothetical protein
MALGWPTKSAANCGCCMNHSYLLCVTMVMTPLQKEQNHHKNSKTIKFTREHFCEFCAFVTIFVFAVKSGEVAKKGHEIEIS